MYVVYGGCYVCTCTVCVVLYVQCTYVLLCVQCVLYSIMSDDDHRMLSPPPAFSELHHTVKQ